MMVGYAIKLGLIPMILKHKLSIVEETFEKLQGDESQDYSKLDAQYREAVKKFQQDAGYWDYEAETPDETFGELSYEKHLIYNNLYASLIVTIWSHVEGTLKEIISEYQAEKNITKKPPYQFKPISDFFLSDVDINLSNSAQYDIIDACRILNNEFKHSEGKYKPDPTKPHTVISSQILSQWQCVNGTDNTIDYSSLPFPLIIDTVASFVSEIASVTSIKLGKEATV